MMWRKDQYKEKGKLKFTSTYLYVRSYDDIKYNRDSLRIIYTY
jgi:hypothetical protein